jgi:ferrochelatase (EC 4.99.1.1)
MKTAVVLFNLGGPTDQPSIKPFLFNLFYDRAILQLPNPFRYFLAKLLANKRAPEAAKIYAHMDGKSPLLEHTQAQAQALEQKLPDGYKVFIAMRYWQPRAEATAQKIQRYSPDKIVFLPLYPQFSMTTTGSSFKEMEGLLQHYVPDVPIARVCCFPDQPDFTATIADLIQAKLQELDPTLCYRLLFSAHGLPKKVIQKGDPYQRHVEETVQAVVKQLHQPGLDFTICYQSRVGPLEWIGPSTEDEIKRAAQDKVQIVMIPIAFVSEHSETLVELDIEYKALAQECRAPGYARVPTVSTDPAFIHGLADLVLQAAAHPSTTGFAQQRRCLASFKQCLNPNSCYQNTDCEEKC